MIMMEDLSVSAVVTAKPPQGSGAQAIACALRIVASTCPSATQRTSRPTFVATAMSRASQDNQKFVLKSFCA
jgi:hypothetical protein